jgi:hypothetical protein
METTRPGKPEHISSSTIALDCREGGDYRERREERKKGRGKKSILIFGASILGMNDETRIPE